jgi:hypothetical protein
MLHKIVTGGIFATNFFLQKQLCFNKLATIKTFRDLTMKIIRLTVDNESSA